MFFYVIPSTCAHNTANNQTNGADYIQPRFEERKSYCLEFHTPALLYFIIIVRAVLT